MRVVFHCVYYPREIGGLESHVAGLAEGLVDRGHGVCVVTSRSRPELPEEESRNGVRVLRTKLPSRTPLGWALHSVGSLPRLSSVARWADILHAQTFASVLPVGLAAGAARRPWVASFHTSHFLARARQRRWQRILGLLVRWPDHALAASAEIARVAGELAPGTPVEPLVNGVDTKRFRPGGRHGPGGDGERWVVVPRRLVRKNGVDYLIRAIPLILAEEPGARFLIVGDGPERAALEALARELGIHSAVRFAGSRPHQEMPTLLASAEIAVLPSLMEATSVAALEAMACGLPVVATEVGGLPEIVGPGVGALVQPADPRALAEGVVALLRDGDLAGMGRRARDRVVTHWSNDRLVDRHVEIYRALLAGRSGRRAAGREGS